MKPISRFLGVLGALGALAVAFPAQAADNIWLGCTTATAQVQTYTPATVEVDDIFTLTITADNGDSVAVSFTATAATVGNVTAGLTAAWNAETDPLCTGVTASDDSTYMTLTADSAGVPFDVTPSTTDGGGNDTQTLTEATTQANVGPYDWNVADNWSLNAVPVATNNVYIPVGAPSILYGLNQSSVALATLSIETGYASNIGRFDTKSNALHYLRCDPDSLTIRGNGSLIAMDVGSAAIAVTINHTGNASAVGRDVVYLIGSAITTVYVEAGTVGVATYPGATATVSAGMMVTGGTLRLGSGTTVTGTTAEVKGGSCKTWVAVPTVKVYCDGNWYQESSNWTTLTGYNGATIYPNASGTYTTTNTYGAVTIDNSANLLSKTFTTTNCYGDLSIVDPTLKITWTNPIGRTPEGQLVYYETGGS